MIPALNRTSNVHKLYKSFLDDLSSSGFEGDIRLDYANRTALATDNSIYQILPQGVIYPRHTQDLLILTQLSHKENYCDIHLSPRGGGTGTNGQALTDGLVVDTSRYMNQIIQINQKECWAHVQCGVVKDQLNSAIKPLGLFFAPELSTSNRATIGGMINTDASGQGSCVYGKTRDHVLELSTVLMDGSLLVSSPIDDDQLVLEKMREGLAGHIYQLADQIDKNYGKGSIMRLGQVGKVDVGVIPTGSISLDIALGVGGVPRGRIIEVFGPESSGKTTLALSIAARAQADGGVVAFIDAEHALDPSYAEKIGVNLEDLLVSQPNYGEQALEICDLLVRSNAVDVVVVDSVAALVPKAELDGEMEDSQVGAQARMMSKAMRKITGACNSSRTTVIFINQIREKIGVMFGSPETQPGGRALKFAASLRIDIRRVTSITEGDRSVGNRVRTKIVKNKVAAPFTKAEFDIMFNEGISYEGDVVDLAVEHKIVQKSGAWYSYGDERIGQGRENAKQYLRDNPKTCEEIAAKVMAKVKEGM